MLTSGLLLTLNADSALARQAQAVLQTRPELTLGECQQRWLPLVAEVADVRASRDLHDWLSALPGVEFVDVVQVNFEDAQSINPTRTYPDSCASSLSPSDGERAGVRGNPLSE